MNNNEPKTWTPITEPLAALQNLINASLLGQSKGAYTLEEAVVVQSAINWIVQRTQPQTQQVEDSGQTETQ